MDVHPTLQELFDGWARTGVRWCLLRGAGDLAAPAGDVDVLVARGDVAAMDGAAVASGFARRRSWRSAGQHSYVALDAAGRWLSLHVTERLVFGPGHGVEVDAVDACLARRVTHGDGGVVTLEPTDELWITLLHGLLDK